MEDIKINTTYKKIQYWVSWIVFILFGMIWAWIVAIALLSYGKDTTDNKDKRKGVLNLTYQKFIYIYGMIMTYILILIWVLSLLKII